MLRIAIEARALSASLGVRTYTLELIRNLIAQHPANYSLVYDEARHRNTFPTANEIVIPLRHEAVFLPWLWWQVPGALQKYNPQVVHFTKAALPIRKIAPTIVTIHDVIPLFFPGSQKLSRRLYWPRALRHAAKNSDHIITVSQQSKKDIVQFLGVDPEKITATPLAVNRTHFQPITDKQRIDHVKNTYNISAPYVLFIGTLEPRKNVAALIRSFSQAAPSIPHTLVIAGKKGWKYHEIFSAHAQSKVHSRIIFLNHIPYDDLPVLLSGADTFVWPSVYEGWGLPPLEAMACGVPVIVSDGGALPEVVGNAGEIVKFSASTPQERTYDDDFEKRLAQTLVRTLSDTNLLRQRRLQGIAQAATFSWERLADQTFAVYEKVASQGDTND